MNSTSGKTFIDTNVLLYAHDMDAGVKHQTAKAILGELWIERTGVVSMQVLQEFYVNLTRKISSPLSNEIARLVVGSYSIWCMDTTPADISAAFRIEGESRIAFWDAMIVSAAVRSGATRILSEDFSAGHQIAGILVENPFALT